MISAAIEEEIAQLEDAERAEFLADLGLEEPGLDRMIHEDIGCLGCPPISRWDRRRRGPGRFRPGLRRPQAAGVIHGDFERGFIRAETIAYGDFVGLGGEQGAKEAGKMRLRARATRSRTGTCCTFSLTLEEVGALGIPSLGASIPLKRWEKQELEGGWKQAGKWLAILVGG